MRELYFIRHGESQANADHIWSPPNSPLTKRGKQQARESGCQARSVNRTFDVILSSPLLRTKATAQIVAGQLAYPLDKIEYLNLFVERGFGKLIGTRSDYLLDKKQWTFQDVNTIAGVETTEHLQHRAALGLQYLQDRGEDHILLIGHGAYARALRRVISGESHELEYDDEVRLATRLTNGELIRLI